MLENQKIKLLIADDNKDFCDLIVEFFEDENDIEIVGVAHDGVEVLKNRKNWSPKFWF